MTTWIFAVLALHFLHIYLTGALYLSVESFMSHAGGRDVMPARGKYGGRANRALDNMKENLPFFLTPALLSYVIPETDTGLAVLGAQIFFGARLVYVPAYLSGIPGPRSIAYCVALFGNLMMFWALIG